MGLDITRMKMVPVVKPSKRFRDEKLHHLGYIRGSQHNAVLDELHLPNLIQILLSATEYGDENKYEPYYGYFSGTVEVKWELIPKALELADKARCGLCKAGYDENTRERRVIDCTIEMLSDMQLSREGLWLEFSD